MNEEKFFDLLTRSEARIDRTNEMVDRLAVAAVRLQEIIPQLTAEYCKHLDDLTACRDALLEQNKTLLRMHEKDLANVQKMRDEISQTHDRIFELLRASRSGVHIENT